MWQSMGSPAIFAVIGDSLPRERRAMGFTVQSILKRVPIVIAPLAGGLLIARLGIVKGIHVSLVVTLLLAVVTLLLVRKITLTARASETTSIRGVWQSFHRVLKRLLVSDVIVRTCEGMTGVLTILYVANVLNYSLAIATFVSFALFPLAVIFASTFALLVVAFVIGGLREIGEPSRKAMIVDFAQEGVRARSVGLYYLVRSLSITPAAAIGGLLWKIAPEVPFLVAGVIGLIGTVVFALTVDERSAS